MIEPYSAKASFLPTLVLRGRLIPQEIMNPAGMRVLAYSSGNAGDAPCGKKEPANIFFTCNKKNSSFFWVLVFIFSGLMGYP